MKIRTMFGAVLAAILAVPVAAADKSEADYPDLLYVHYSSTAGGCTMAVSEGHLAYGLFSQALVCHVLPVGRTVHGRFFNRFGAGQWVELIFPDKGKMKTEKYQVTFQKTF